MRVLGLDIGGANLKAADNEGAAAVRAFALWKSPESLAGELQVLTNGWKRAAGRPLDRIAVTMTAELCDCFETKAEGVDFILKAVAEFAGDVPVSVWQTGGEFVSPDVARDIPLLVAAANWHALATFAGRMVLLGAALLMDVGSTTTDIIPLHEGVPTPAGLTDWERLQTGELVYTGVRRTPVCALMSDADRPLAAELFATTLDVYLLLGDISADSADCETANGKPATMYHARDRLARMRCCDRNELSASDIESLARQLAESQRSQILQAVECVRQRLTVPCRHIILSGSGEFLARRVIAKNRHLQSAELHSLPQLLGGDVAMAACAFAAARLAVERC